MGHLTEEGLSHILFMREGLERGIYINICIYGDEYYGYFMIFKTKCHSCIFLSKSNLPLRKASRKENLELVGLT